jgi:serine/threonine protein kinase
MFIINGLIGEGGFGKVMTALFVKTHNWHAIKEIDKVELLKHKTGTSMINAELKALKRVDHAFIISLHFAFQDK